MTEQPAPQTPSGLSDAVRAARGVAAAALATEALVLLLAIQPIRVLGGHLSGFGVAAVVVLAVIALVLAGLLRRPWAWLAGSILQLILMACGWLHWSLGVLGAIFALVWLYCLNVRHTVTKRR
jgi:hypothetical protein